MLNLSLIKLKKMTIYVHVQFYLLCFHEFRFSLGSSQKTSRGVCSTMLAKKSVWRRKPNLYL